MHVTRAAVPLKNRDGLGGPGDVVSFIGHLSPRIHNRSTINAGSGHVSTAEQKPASEAEQPTLAILNVGGMNHR